MKMTSWVRERHCGGGMEGCGSWRQVEKWNEKANLNEGTEGKGSKQKHHIYITGFCAGALMWNGVHQNTHIGTTYWTTMNTKDVSSTLFFILVVVSLKRTVEWSIFKEFSKTQQKNKSTIKNSSVETRLRTCDCHKLANFRLWPPGGVLGIY